MKRFLVTVDTQWCGTEQTYRVEAELESDLYEKAEQAAYENYYSYFGSDDELLEDAGYDPEELSEEEKEQIISNIDESQFYSWNIEEFHGDEEEWNGYTWLE